MEEIFKDIFYIDCASGEIIDYRGKYQVSNFGRVKSLNFNRTGEEKILKEKKCKGYLCVALCKNGKSKYLKIHRLVAHMFLEHTYPTEKRQVNHIDENKINNNINNLEFVTNSENQKHGTLPQRKAKKISESTKGKRRGKEHHNSKPVISMNIDGDQKEFFWSTYLAEEETGARAANINKCCRYYELDWDIKKWFTIYNYHPSKIAGSYSDGSKRYWRYATPEEIAERINQ